MAKLVGLVAAAVGVALGVALVRFLAPGDVEVPEHSVPDVVGPLIYDVWDGLEDRPDDDLP